MTKQWWTADDLDAVLTRENDDSWDGEATEATGLEFADGTGYYGQQSLGEDGWYYLKYEEVDLKHPQFGLIENVENRGGEGDGAQMWQTIRTTEPNGTVRYFERTGRFSSWGADEGWSELYEVEPYETIVTRYKKL